jgi:hypothetical protein
MRTRGSRARQITVATVASVAIATAAAPATVAGDAASERREYVSELESICKPRALATQRVVKGARGDVSAERFDVAAGKFARANRIFSATLKRIGAVRRPPADRAPLRKWFGYLRQQESYLEQIVLNLEADRGVAAQRLIARFIHNGNLANESVLEFGFNHCAFKFSRYG